MTRYRPAIRRLCMAINKSKLVVGIDGKPWTLGCKLITRKVKARSKSCSLNANKDKSVSIDDNSLEGGEDC